MEVEHESDPEEGLPPVFCKDCFMVEAPEGDGFVIPKGYTVGRTGESDDQAFEHALTQLQLPEPSPRKDKDVAPESKGLAQDTGAPHTTAVATGSASEDSPNTDTSDAKPKGTEEAQLVERPSRNSHYALTSLFPCNNPVWTPGIVRLMALKETTKRWATLEPFVECAGVTPEAKLAIFKKEMIRHATTGVRPARTANTLTLFLTLFHFFVVLAD
jgi:hypothetical protein